MRTLTAKETLIPATARFNIAHANKGLWTHTNLLNEAAARRGKGIFRRLRMAGCVVDLLRLWFSQHWLSAGQHTGWRCDQPSTIKSARTMHIKKVPRTPS